MPHSNRTVRCLARPTAIAFAAFCLAAAGAALADVDLGIGRGDSVRGTFDPAAEVEVFRVDVPSGAKITAKIKGSKGAKGHVTLATAGGPVLATGVAASPTSGTETLVHTTTASGAYVVSATSRDTTVGAYSLSVKWTTPTRRTGVVSFGGGPQQVFVFSADEGATATISAKAAPGSAALPRVLRIDGPDAFALTPALGGTTPSVNVPATPLGLTGDYVILLENGAATPGDVEVTVVVKAPKRKARKVDVTTAALGDVGNAIGEVVGEDGAVIEVGDLGLGGGLDDISGARIAIPSGAVPAGTPIFIGSAQPLDPKGAPTPIGAPVSFGPDGQKFATPVTITLPIAITDVPLADIAVFTRGDTGKVSRVTEPLNVDLGAGTVSFPASHFSDYVVVTVGELPDPDRFYFSVVTGLSDPGDVTFAALGSTPDSLYLVTEGETVLAVKLSVSSGYSTEVYAGGGSQTTDGTDRLAFGFGERVNAVLVNGDIVYVATSTTVYAVDDTTGAVTRVFGTGVSGDGGDGGPGIAAQLTECVDISIGLGGTILLVDRSTGRIRTLDSNGDAGTFAGNGTSDTGADGPDVLSTSLDQPSGVSADFLANVTYVAERTRLRRIDGSGAITTVAGDPAGAAGCNDPIDAPTTARFTSLASVSAVAVFIDEETIKTKVYVTDSACHVVWLFDPEADTLVRVAGTLGSPGVTEDGEGVSLVDTPGAILGFNATAWVFLETGTGTLRQLVSTE